jgi:hypothetical protein
MKVDTAVGLLRALRRLGELLHQLKPVALWKRLSRGPLDARLIFS